MSDQQRLFLWIVASGGFASLLGGAFGAAVGAFTWLNGRAAGTAIGYRVARAYETAAGHELSPGKKGALIGGTDGAAFLGACGMLLGAIVASQTPAAGEILGPTAAVVLLIVAAAALFGWLAYLLLRTGVRAVGPLFAGAVLGGSVGRLLGHVNGLFAGLILGVIAGTVAAFLWGSRRS